MLFTFANAMRLSEATPVLKDMIYEVMKIQRLFIKLQLQVLTQIYARGAKCLYLAMHDLYIFLDL